MKGYLANWKHFFENANRPKLLMEFEMAFELGPDFLLCPTVLLEPQKYTSKCLQVKQSTVK